ncbi:MAG TPA: sigma-70 family RNA polymerase sigma factor [Labilithrix sp.]|jgi:RNA polymerase sigma-70 factor (ECF subfamily)|nr:sigma-70 family RNA polymerase sigma factor [Labilithrix sp.]
MTRLEEAMQRFAEGDDAQLSIVYDVAAPPLYSFLLRLCRDRALAEDLTHETFLRVHSARASYKLGAAVLPWMYAIGRRLFLNHVRSHKRHAPSLEAARPDSRQASDPGIAATGPSADDMVVADRLAARIEQLLADMPETQSTAFRLLKQEYLSVAEAAAILGTTETTVRLRAHRAYEALRVALGRDWDLDGTSAAAHGKGTSP